MSEKIMQHPLAAALVIAFLSAVMGTSLGFNISQIAVVGDVKTNTREISNLKDLIATNQKNNHEEIGNLVALFTKNLDQNREFIELLRVQNDLLTKKK